MQRFKKHYSLIFSTLIPSLVMLIYFIHRHFAPFGSSSLLTVDMGQQYVAFYEYFRHVILGHFGELFYSFTNGLGGDMFGTWAYYLFSPTNLILLFFKKESITTGILVVTLVKYALAGLTSSIYLSHLVSTNKQKTYKPVIIGFATAYSLMGFSIANQLNLFWLDAPILLPIIILGLDQLIDHHRAKLFVTSMGLMVVINYYFAYMIGIFSLLYFIWKTNYWSFKSVWSFIRSWIYIIAFSAIAWMPTLWALIHGKANYTENNIQWNFEYNPLKMLTKLIPGTFSFKQMSAGLPNIYIGMFILIGCVAYFCNSHIKTSKRLVGLGITTFFIISFCFSPLDLFWHAMQFPWWYAYRFSFIFSFWMMILAFQSLQVPLQRHDWLKAIIANLALLTLIGYSSIKYLSKISNYMNNNQLEFGVIIFIAALVFWIGFQSKKINPYVSLALLIFMVADVSTNAVWSLNRISYVTQTEFENYGKAARSALAKVKPKNHEFTRIGTNYFRSKNDPTQLNYYSGSSFNSNLETNSLNAMAALGQPTTSGNITYMNGTLISDSILSFKYWSLVNAQPKNNPFLTKSVRHDILNRYIFTSQTKHVNNYLNPHVLPLGLTTHQLVSNHLKHQEPMDYQNELMQALSNSKQPLFTDITNQAQIYFSNVTATTNIKNGVLNKQKLNKTASITFELHPQTDDPIYLTAGSELSYNNADIYVNNQRITEDIDYEHPIILSVADKAKGKTVRVQIVLKKSNLILSDFNLASLNFTNFEKDYQKAHMNGLTHIKSKGNVVTGTLHVDRNNRYLFTSIPYNPGWKIKVDDKTISTTKVANYFIGSSQKISPGKHQIKLTYIPPLLIPGLIITLISFFIAGLLKFKNRK